VVDRPQLGVDGVEVSAHMLERALGERVGQPLAREPGLMLLGPGLLAFAVDVAVAQQLLGDPVARRGARPAQVLAGPDMVTQPLLLGRGRLNEGELAGAVEAHQLLGVAAVGLDAIAGPDRHQRRRDHIAGNPHAREQPKQVVTARPRLVRDGQTVRAAEPVEQTPHRPLGVLNPRHLRRAARRRQHAGHERVLVHIEHDPPIHIGRSNRANVRHGLVLLRMRHWPQRNLTTATLTRDRYERRGPARHGVHTD
jgi:hypothetical protein